MPVPGQGLSEQDRQFILDSFGVTREEIEALDPDDSYARAREGAKREMKELEERLIARGQKLSEEFTERLHAAGYEGTVEFHVEKLR